MENESWVRIPMPSLLADRADTPSNRDPATSSEASPVTDRSVGNERVVAYARLLWSELDRVGDYLRDHVGGGGSGPVLAQTEPILTNDDQWQRWSEIYAQTLTTLAGPAGDQGYGAEQAQLLYDAADHPR
jgi:hypothetical protein